MKLLEQHGLKLSHLLCAVAIFSAVLPMLRQPRLEADDYRYLNLIEQVRNGKTGMIEAMTVENRWDHLWFMQEEGRIRFFRPTVLLSYALDQALWGEKVELGLTLSNVWIHLACSMLVGFLFFRLLGAGLPALSAAVLFAGLAAHTECIWYIAGRTDSLAALGFLAAFALHLSGRRWWALPCFAFGFLTKELVIAAPVVFLAFDWWVARQKIDWRLYGSYAVLGCVLLLLKRAALGGEGSDFVAPYLISPLSRDFPQHLWLQFRSYAGNLIAAEPTVPFADAETVAQFHRPLFPIIGTGGLAAAAWLLCRDRRFRLFLLLGFLTWLPTSFVYLSERYLYLPSVAYAGIIGLLAATRPPKMQTVLSVLIGAYALFQTLELRGRHKAIAAQPGSVREMIRQLEPVRDRIEKGDRLLLVNLPGMFVRAQFAQDILRVALHDPELQVDVLTMMPGQNGAEWNAGDPPPVMGAGVLSGWKGGALTLRGRVFAPGQPPSRIQEPGLKHFNWAPLKAGSAYTTPALKAVVESADSVGATAVVFSLADRTPAPKLIIWHADCSNLSEHPWERRKKAVVELIALPSGRIGL